MIYITLTKYKKIIIIGILILFIFFLYFKNKKENLTVIEEDELISNIIKKYTDNSGTFIFNNLNSNKLITNNINISELIKIRNNIDPSGNFNIDSSGNFNIDPSDNLNNNTDISGNMTVNNLKINNNLDILGALNIIKTYYTCTLVGTLDLNKIRASIVKFMSTDIKLISDYWWTQREIKNISYDKNNTIDTDFKNGVINGFDEKKVYKLEVYIHLYILSEDYLDDDFIVKWINNSNNTELSKVTISLNKVKYHTTLTNNICATGGNSYTLSLQKYGADYHNSIQTTTTIVITEL